MSSSTTSTPALDAVLHCEKNLPSVKEPSTEIDLHLLPSSNPPMGSGLVDHDPVVALTAGNDINRATKMISSDRRRLIWKPLLTFGVPALMQRSSTLACRRTPCCHGSFPCSLHPAPRRGRRLRSQLMTRAGNYSS